MPSANPWLSAHLSTTGLQIYQTSSTDGASRAMATDRRMAQPRRTICSRRHLRRRSSGQWNRATARQGDRLAAPGALAERCAGGSLLECRQALWGSAPNRRRPSGDRTHRLEAVNQKPEWRPRASCVDPAWSLEMLIGTIAGTPADELGLSRATGRVNEEAAEVRAAAQGVPSQCQLKWQLVVRMLPVSPVFKPAVRIPPSWLPGPTLAASQMRQQRAAQSPQLAGDRPRT